MLWMIDYIGFHKQTGLMMLSNILECFVDEKMAITLYEPKDSNTGR